MRHTTLGAGTLLLVLACGQASDDVSVHTAPTLIFPKGVLDQELRVTDDDGNNIAATVAKLAVQGTFVASQLANYPSDTSLKDWFKGLLNTPSTGPGPCRFNDNF